MASTVQMAASGVSARALSSASASCSSNLDRVEWQTLRASSCYGRTTFLARPLTRSLPSQSKRQPQHAGGGRVVAAARGGGRRDGDQTSKQVLDAFFLGRAFAETINERLGTALGELISEVSRAQAEQREFIRQFQEEVQNRAEEELSKAAKSVLWEPPTSSTATYQPVGQRPIVSSAPPDVPVSVADPITPVVPVTPVDPIAPVDPVSPAKPVTPITPLKSGPSTIKSGPSTPLKSGPSTIKTGPSTPLKAGPSASASGMDGRDPNPPSA